MLKAKVKRHGGVEAPCSPLVGPAAVPGSWDLSPRALRPAWGTLGDPAALQLLWDAAGGPVSHRPAGGLLGWESRLVYPFFPPRIKGVVFPDEEAQSAWAGHLALVTAAWASLGG